MCRLIGILGFLLGCAAAAANTNQAAALRQIVIDIPALESNASQSYYLQLLQLALERSRAPDEQIVYRYARWSYSQARWIYLLQHDPDNLVIWTMTSKDRESLLLPVRIPLFRGLFGKRVFIIRKRDQWRFDQVHSAADLKNLVAGQGMHWPDVDVFQANGLQVTTAARSGSLIRMLKAGRFDYFPRAITEAWHELETLDDDELAVENQLLVEYPTAVYFFVGPHNPALAERIRRGLESLIDSGEFERFFYAHPRIRDGLAALQQSPRRVIRLDNPDLPDQLPPAGERYWIKGTLFDGSHAAKSGGSE